MADLRTFHVEVIQLVEVTLDADKFDEAFMEEFRESFFPFHSLKEHAEHIGQLCARGIIDELSERRGEFIEGYGPSRDMGITAMIVQSDEEIAE